LEQDKDKLSERRGRKATALDEIAGLADHGYAGFFYLSIIAHASLNKGLSISLQVLRLNVENGA